MMSSMHISQVLTDSSSLSLPPKMYFVSFYDLTLSHIGYYCIARIYVLSLKITFKSLAQFFYSFFVFYLIHTSVCIMTHRCVYHDTQSCVSLFYSHTITSLWLLLMCYYLWIHGHVSKLTLGYALQTFIPLSFSILFSTFLLFKGVLVISPHMVVFKLYTRNPHVLVDHSPINDV